MKKPKAEKSVKSDSRKNWIDISPSRRVFAVIKEFKGKQYFDIREYYFDSSVKQWKPGKKGVSVPLGLRLDLERVLQYAKPVGETNFGPIKTKMHDEEQE